MKRTYYIIIVVSIITVGVYLYIHFSLSQIKDAKQGHPKPQSDIDLRPLITTKLRQLVKEGSNGLYNLSVEKLEPDILRSELDVLDATLTPDTSELARLDIAKKAPDNVFKFSFDSLHITGITVNDLLHKDRLSLDSVFITRPTVEAYYQPRPYNKAKRNEDDSATVYKRLMKRFKSISVHAIVVNHGTLINKDLYQKKGFKGYNDINMHASNLLIDSITQYDKNRFLFAGEAELSCEDYKIRTPENLYNFKIGSISVNATKHTIIAKNVSLLPRYTKEEFKKKVSSRKDYFDMRFPKVVLSSIDWWAFANNENLSAVEADIYNARIKDYIDRSLPGGSTSADNFPAQLLMQIPLKINIGRLNLHSLDVAYEEHNPETEKSSRIYFDNINGAIQNLTNLPASIKINKNLSFSGSGLFMHQIPFRCSFQFDLSKYKTCNFSTDIEMATLDNTILNPVTEPLSLFTIKKGTMQKATLHIEGNTAMAKSKMLILYNDLHITPLKVDDSGSLKKKPFTGFFANTFFIINDNPAKGRTPRNAEVFVKRDNEPFFGFIWKIMLKGILKTIGVPLKYAEQ